MLGTAIVDDEVNDLLKIAGNLIALDPTANEIRVFPVLISEKRESSVRKEEERWWQNFGAVLRANGVLDFTIPRIKVLPAVDTTKEYGAAQVLEYISGQGVDLIISDSSMGEQYAGIVLLETALSNPRWAQNEWQCWLMTRYDRIAKTIKDFRWRGKFDPHARYLDKHEILTGGEGECHPLLRHVIELGRLGKEAAARLTELKSCGALIGQSQLMNRVYKLIELYGEPSIDETILISGSTGTGKELVAREIHERSRSGLPFIGVNCAAIPNELFESELFGHDKGSFSGAHADKKGLFEVADRGTLFLDEIAKVDKGMQAKLLRALQEKKIRRVGSASEINVNNVRFIAATNRNLRDMVEKETFNDDLYYRLNVLEIKMPLLSERREDIGLLAKHFINGRNQQTGRDVKLSEDALEVLQRHDWPGNVRQLQSCILRAFILCKSDEIEPCDIQIDEKSDNWSSQVSPSSGTSARSLTLFAGDSRNKRAVEDWQQIRCGNLSRSLSDEREKLGEDEFPHFLKLLLTWLDENYGEKHLPPDKIISKMFGGMTKNNFKVRLGGYQKKYGLRRQKDNEL